MIFERFPVEHLDFAVVALADAFVKALAGFFAEPVALDHFLFEIEREKTVSPRIIGNQVVEIAADKGPYVQADDIEQAEAGAIGQADQRSSERVDFFDGEILFDHGFGDGATEKAAN